MIRGMHAMFYTSQPEALRAFFRDKLGFTGFDVGDGWLIFNMNEADLGCHPAEVEQGNPSGMPSVSFYCDDIKQTVKELKDQGVEFVDEVADHGYGLVTHFRAPGDFNIQLFQPLYRKH
jgi:catechol 2,3-dioxygenase-like lactoylglutathione lyase family enzyme